MADLERERKEVEPRITIAEIAGQLFERGSLDIVVGSDRRRLVSRVEEGGRFSHIIETQRPATQQEGGLGFVPEGRTTAGNPQDALLALVTDKVHFLGPIRNAAILARGIKNQ